jgi:hypothetical protein
MLGSVTATNTARIPTITNTIRVCAFATSCGPTTTTSAIATTTADVKTLSHQSAPVSLTNSETA